MITAQNEHEADDHYDETINAVFLALSSFDINLWMHPASHLNAMTGAHSS